jgi:hypothetical protein
MKTLQMYGIAAAVMLAFSGVAQAQGSTSAPADRPAARTDGSAAGSSNRAERKAKDAEEERIEAAYKADKAKCDTMNGNAKDVCEKEAKGKEKVAKAELDAKKNPSERNQRNVEQAKAEAQYEVAKERCDDMKGKDKDACQKDAKAQHEKAKAAMAKRNASAGATTERRPATQTGSVK